MERQRASRSVSDDSLSEWDRRVVRDAHAELEASPTPTVLSPFLALAAALAGGLILAAWLTFRDVVPAASFLAPFVMLFGVLLSLGGVFALVAALRGGSRAHAIAGDAALRRLVTEGEDRETRLRAAVLLICSGAAAAGGFDPADVAIRLGSARPLVESVERLLVEERGIDPLLNGPHGPVAEEGGDHGR